MSSPTLYGSLIATWPIVVVAAATARLTFGVSTPSLGEGAGWIFAAVAPVATAALLSRSRATQAIAKVLYDANNAGDAKPPSSPEVPRG